LIEMSEGRGRLEWAQTSEVVCALYETNRDRKKRSKPFLASEFNPYAGKDGKRKSKAVAGPTEETMSDLKAALAASFPERTKTIG
jgi:hypothetical protein